MLKGIIWRHAFTCTCVPLLGAKHAQKVSNSNIFFSLFVRFIRFFSHLFFQLWHIIDADITQFYYISVRLVRVCIFVFIFGSRFNTFVYLLEVFFLFCLYCTLNGKFVKETNTPKSNQFFGAMQKTELVLLVVYLLCKKMLKMMNTFDMISTHKQFWKVSVNWDISMTWITLVNRNDRISTRRDITTHPFF